MKDEATSLDRLHDIVLPPDVSWWPLAAGWQLVLALVFAAACFLAYRVWKKWMSNAYRRAALRELAGANDVSSVAEILRRTALAVAPREEIAGMSGETWLEWMNARCADAFPNEVGRQLTDGVYGHGGTEHDLSSLRDHAARWIAQHHIR